MKVGILTYHNTNNFGGALQTYALLTAVKKLGVECEVIDYKSKTITERYKVKKLKDVRNIKGLIKFFMNNNANLKTKKLFDSFYDNYLDKSERIYDKDTMKLTNEVYDNFIVGSDQVWNLSLSGNDYTYFLDFVSNIKKRDSYAASFGISKLDMNTNEKICSLLNKFDNISLREPKPQNFIELKDNRKISVNLDPTFLINKEEWSSLCKNEINTNDYILVYAVSSNPIIFEFAKELSRKNNNCKIVYLHHTHNIRFDMINVRDIGPQEFLGYIKNAKYIITTSFHGVALSINFEKDFYYALSNQENNFNSRISNIINLLGLSSQQIKKGKELNNYKPIDYSNVNKKLEVEIEKSKNYLKSIVLQ